MDLDSPGRSRKRAIFCGVCRKLVEQQGEAGNHRPRLRRHQLRSQRRWSPPRATIGLSSYFRSYCLSPEL